MTSAATAIPTCSRATPAACCGTLTGRGDGTFYGRAKVGGGWGGYTQITGAGDINGDGFADIVARATNGHLYLYQGTGNGKAPFKARVDIGGGWNTYTKLAAPGDLDGDGRADIVAVTSGGELYRYSGSGHTGTATFKPRAKIGTAGWNTYSNLLYPPSPTPRTLPRAGSARSMCPARPACRALLVPEQESLSAVRLVQEETGAAAAGEGAEGCAPGGRPGGAEFGGDGVVAEVAAELEVGVAPGEGEGAAEVLGQAVAVGFQEERQGVLLAE